MINKRENLNYILLVLNFACVTTGIIVTYISQEPWYLFFVVVGLLNFVNVVERY